MKTIWKFPLAITDAQAVDLPEGAEIIACQAQRNSPCLWALVDSAAPKVPRHFATYGTGHEFHGGKYVGTYQVEGGRLVFHVFEILN